MDKTNTALELVHGERERQRQLWGEEDDNHPFEWVAILGEEYGELCEAVNETFSTAQRHPERGGADNILREAVQVAAVAVKIIEVMLK